MGLGRPSGRLFHGASHLRAVGKIDISHLDPAIGPLQWPAFMRSHSFSCRGLAQLVEHRSPKPRVVGSSPSAPAIYVKKLGTYFINLPVGVI